MNNIAQLIQVFAAILNVTPKRFGRSKLATPSQPVRRPPLTSKRKRTVRFKG